MNNIEPHHDPDVEGEAKERRCLKCGKKFHSHSFGNRVCGVCNRGNKHEVFHGKLAGGTGPTGRAVAESDQ